MATLQQEIFDKFLAKLAQSKEFDTDRIQQLRTLLAGNKKPKLDDLVKVFSSATASEKP